MAHCGRLRINPNSDGSVSVLCPLGHIVTRVRKGEWSGSIWEAKVSFGDKVTCDGTVSKDV